MEHFFNISLYQKKKLKGKGQNGPNMLLIITNMYCTMHISYRKMTPINEKMNVSKCISLRLLCPSTAVILLYYGLGILRGPGKCRSKLRYRTAGGQCRFGLISKGQHGQCWQYVLHNTGEQDPFLQYGI